MLNRIHNFIRHRDYRLSVVFLILVMAAGAVTALAFRKMPLSYTTADHTDSAVTLKAGDKVSQPYMAVRQHVTSVTFQLDGDETLQGTYTLAVTGEQGREYVRVSSHYDGQESDRIAFLLPEELNPDIGEQLYYQFTVEDGADDVSLAADSTLDTATVNQAESGSTLGIELGFYKNSRIYILYCLLFLLLGLAYLSELVFGISFNTAVGCGVICSSVIVYILGIAHVLWIAPAVVFGLAGCGFVLAIADGIRSRNAGRLALNQAVFLVLFIIAAVFIANRMTIYFPGGDEVWFYSNALDCYRDHKIPMTSEYGILLNVYSYLFETINGMFSANIMRACYLLYEGACLFVLFDLHELNRRAGRLLSLAEQIGIFVFLWITLLCIRPVSFNSSGNDIPFTALMIWVVYLYFYHSGRSRNVLMAAGLCAAMFLKNTGVLFACILIIFAVMDLIRALRKDRKRIDASLQMLIALLIAASLATGLKFYYSRHYNDSFSVMAAQEQDFSGRGQGTPLLLSAQNGSEDRKYGTTVGEAFQAAGDILQGHLTSSFGAIMKEWFAAVLELPVVFGLSGIGIMSGTLLVAMLYYVVIQRREDTTFLHNVLKLEFGAALWVIMLSYKYLFNIEEENRYEINTPSSSFDRYCTPYLFMMILMIVIHVLMLTDLKEAKHSRIVRERLVVLLAAVLLFLHHGNLTGLSRTVTDAYDYTLEVRDSLLQKNNALLSTSGSMFVISTAQTVPDKANIYLSNDVRALEYPAVVNYPYRVETDLFLNTDYSGYSYVLLVNYDKTFLEGCSDLFENGISDVHRRAYYKVTTKEDGSRKLHYIGDAPISGDMLLSLDGSVPINGVTNQEQEDPSPEEFIRQFHEQETERS